MPANPAKTLLSPDNHSLLMIDHQYLQMLTIRSHDASEIVNHAVALVEAAVICTPRSTVRRLRASSVQSSSSSRTTRGSSHELRVVRSIGTALVARPEGRPNSDAP
jgi:hypothetical protein